MKNTQLGEKDLKLLALLREDGRMTWTRMAEQIGVSRVAVQNRVEALKKKGIITGFTVLTRDIASEQRPLTIFVRIRFAKGMDGTRFIGNIGGQRGVVSAWAVAGSWDCILEVRAANMEEVAHIRDLIVAFGGIEEIETECVLKVLKRGPV
ncbi:Lrp/AsnC family transcriptional regulator [Pseudohoeflea coraliihabitans]|uniref:Lrp/AsnC family transcriptional regulator n=1 Tax=Pseudohoeflea coraliihabitans TaxID=2860393 RepID=A0ABS6WIL5_9HYPH|nr:Lrp/AsnC family transcriptional regulator [Pseudohoeflea sp. DP4N28-3]MBW3095798.1 Lrp/AsnC family transcriptional regulator [Pseudohoeflea sp. DP4N28-3]